jgi:hypothetical protein
MDIADLFVALTISNQQVLIAGSIIVSVSRDCVLASFLIVNGLIPPDPHKPWPRDTVSDSAIWVGAAHIS